MNDLLVRPVPDGCRLTVSRPGSSGFENPSIDSGYRPSLM